MGEGDLGLRYWNSRISRRRVLAGAAATAAAAGSIAIVGCGGGSKNNGGGGNGGNGGALPTARVQDGYQDGPAKPGGILRVRQATALPSMNPFGPGILTLAQGLTLGFTVFDHMWYVPTDTGEVELFLATKVEQPDAQTVIATIGDATFQEKQTFASSGASGRKIDAEDIVQSFKRYREEVGIGFDFLHDIMEDITSPGPMQVKITTKFPWAWIFTSSNAGSPLVSNIMPKEILHGWEDKLTQDAIGSGHWILAGHENGANIRFRKFPKFRTFQNGRDITGQPYLDGVDFVYITDDNAALAAFRTGDIDTYGFSGRKEMEDTQSQLGDKIVTGQDLSRDYLNLMMIYEPPFTDIRVREAFNKLIDRDEAILLLNDGDALKCGPIPPAHKKYVLPDNDPTVQDYFTPNVAEAKKLLDAAGWDYNQEWELKHSNRPVDSSLAQVLQQQLSRGGVKIKLVQEDLVKWFSQTLNQSQFKLTCFQHLPYEDPDLPLRFYLSAKEGRSNFMKYGEDEVDKAVLAAAQELNEEERVKKVQEAQRVVMKHYSPMLNILSAINFGARYAYVKGSITGRGSYGLFNRTTWLDKA